MMTKQDKNHKCMAEKAWYIISRSSGGWNMVVFQSHLYEALGRLESQDRKYYSAVLNYTQSATSRQHHQKIGSILAQALYQQGSVKCQQLCYHGSYQDLQQVFSIKSLKKYAFKIRQLAGLLPEITTP